MEDNSSRRSSDEEHQLIKRIFNHELHREGILYLQDGIDYHDSRTSFRLINAYRTCLRLYQEFGLFRDEMRDGREEELDEIEREASDYWRTAVGKAQGEEMWLLQCLCKTDWRSDPLPVNFDNFNRRMTIKSLRLNRFTNTAHEIMIPVLLDEKLTLDGKLADGLGLDFAICNGYGDVPAEISSPDFDDHRDTSALT